jgi:hypothetical protein
MRDGNWQNAHRPAHLAVERPTIIKLHLFGQVQNLPGVVQKGQELLEPRRIENFDVNRLVEHIFADRKVILGLVAMQITRSDQIHLMELIAIVGRRSRLTAPGQTASQPQVRAGEIRDCYAL